MPSRYGQRHFFRVTGLLNRSPGMSADPTFSSNSLGETIALSNGDTYEKDGDRWIGPNGEIATHTGSTPDEDPVVGSEEWHGQQAALAGCT